MVLDRLIIAQLMGFSSILRFDSWTVVTASQYYYCLSTVNVCCVDESEDRESILQG